MSQRATYITLAVAIAAVTTSTVARANPRPLPFTYNYETLPEGEGEIEQYVDYTPVKAASQSLGRPVTYGATQFQTEFEYGITNHLELGLYVTFAPTPPTDLYNTATLTEGTGIKQRLRLRLADENKWPLDVALYGEVVENSNEMELEAKIILQKRFGDLRIAANVVGEREFYFINQRDWVLNPSIGATYQVTPTVHLGAEYWMRAEYPDPAPVIRPFNLGPHHMVGPTAMFNFGRLWWSTGVYVRVDDFGRSLNAGDAFGPIWVRTIIGITL